MKNKRADVRCIIYTREEACPYCEKAKQLLLDNDLGYTEIMLRTPEQKANAVAMLKEKFDIELTTVPQIIIDGQYIGGYTELVSWVARLADEADDCGFDGFAI